MRKTILLLFLTFMLDGLGQKFGYVDMSYILGQMPDYKEAQAEVSKLAKGWEDEIQKMYQEVETMQAELQAEEVLLTKEMYQDRQGAIDTRWKEIKEYQKKIFGFEGLYFLKKKELINPIQDRVFEAVEIVAKNNRLQIVFDKSGELVMIYTDPIHDYTDFVLERMELEQETNN